MLFYTYMVDILKKSYIRKNNHFIKLTTYVR